MPHTEQTLGVCLYQLAAKDEAVLQRVLTFSGSQGKAYRLTDIAQAQLLIVADETEVPWDQLGLEGSLLVRIVEQNNQAPCDLELRRPLLVTRVMRTLDEARKLWLDSLSESQPEQQTEPSTEAIPAPISVPVAEVPVIAAPVAEILPVAVEAEQPTQTEAAPEVPIATIATTIEADAPAASPYHHHALVVDDSAAIRKQLELELQQAGISSDFAETGEEALEKVAQGRYDLIFLDIVMPGIDGFETCRQLRLRRELKKTPIIMLSAKTSPLDEVQGVIAGASTYLTKPVKSEQLQKTLRRVSLWLDTFQVSV